jgi:hypothetical protein
LPAEKPNFSHQTGLEANSSSCERRRVSIRGRRRGEERGESERGLHVGGKYIGAVEGEGEKAKRRERRTHEGVEGDLLCAKLAGSERLHLLHDGAGSVETGSARGIGKETEKVDELSQSSSLLRREKVERSDTDDTFFSTRLRGVTVVVFPVLRGKRTHEKRGERRKREKERSVSREPESESTVRARKEKEGVRTRATCPMGLKDGFEGGGPNFDESRFKTSSSGSSNSTPAA